VLTQRNRFNFFLVNPVSFLLSSALSHLYTGLKKIVPVLERHKKGSCRLPIDNIDMDWSNYVECPSVVLSAAAVDSGKLL